MSLPSITWDLDPVFYRFELPLFPTLLVVAIVAALGALAARRREDVSGQQLGWVVAAAAGVAAFYFKGETWSPGLRYYSLLFVVVFLGGYGLLHWQLRRGGADEEEAGDFIVYGVVAVLAGARLGHVLFYDLDKALRDPVWVLKIWTGGLASHGAVIGLIIAMFLFTKRRGVPFLEGSDRFSFSAALGAALVRLGNFFNSEIVGRPTDQTWGVRFPRYIDDARLAEPPLRHPSQLYEFALGLGVLGALYVADRLLGKEKRPRGFLISLFFVLYFTGRFFIEFVKEYQTLPPDSLLTMGQRLSIPGVLLGVYGLWWSLKHRLPAGWHPTVRRDRKQGDDEDFDEEDFDDEDVDEEDYRDRDVDEEFGAAPRMSQRRIRVRKDADEDEESPPRRKKRKRTKTSPEKRAASSEEDTADERPSKRVAPKKKKKKRKKKPALSSEHADSSTEKDDIETPSRPDADESDADKSDADE